MYRFDVALVVDEVIVVPFMHPCPGIVIVGGDEEEVEDMVLVGFHKVSALEWLVWCHLLADRNRIESI